MSKRSPAFQTGRSLVLAGVLALAGVQAQAAFVAADWDGGDSDIQSQDRNGTLGSVGITGTFGTNGNFV